MRQALPLPRTRRMSREPPDLPQTDHPGRARRGLRHVWGAVLVELTKRIGKHLRGFAVWLGWATLQAVVGGAVGLLLVSLYLRGR